MKLHLPLLLRRSLLALLASFTLLPASAESVLVRTETYPYAPVGTNFNFSFNTQTGEVKYTGITGFWRDNTSKTVTDENGNKVSAKTKYERKYAEALSTSTIINVFYDAEKEKYSHSKKYEASFLNKEDGEGGDYICYASDVDADGHIINPGVWILSPSTCSSTDVFQMQNYGDIYISDSRQQYNFFTPIASEEGEIQYRVDAINYKDRHMVGIVPSGTSGYVDDVSSVGFGLDVRDSDSFTYTRAYTASTGSFSSGMHEYFFSNVKDIAFSDNRADGSGGLFYGKNWSFYVENSENVRFIGNSSGGAGTIGYAAQSSVWSGGHQGGLQFFDISGEVLFEGNEGSCLGYNVSSQFVDVNQLTFRDNHCMFFRGYNASIVEEMTRCNTILVTGNVAESAEGLYVNPTEACVIRFTDCGNVSFTDNTYKCYLFAGPSNTVFNSVDNLTFSGNTALDGALVGHGLAVNELTGSFTISGNTAIRANNSDTNCAFFNSRPLGYPGRLMVYGTEEKGAESFVFDSNTAMGRFYGGFVAGNMTVERINQVSFCANQMISESSKELYNMFADIAITEAKKVNIDNNSIHNVGGVETLLGTVQVTNYDTFSFSGNSMLSDASGLKRLWEKLTLSNETGQAKSVTIADNVMQGGVWTSDLTLVCDINGADLVSFRDNVAIETFETPASSSILNGICSSAINGSTYTGGYVALTQCKKVEFIGNELIHKGRGEKEYSSYGAALSGNVNLKNIDTLTFRGNHAYATDVNGYASGGAAYIYTFKSLSQIGTITFDANIAGGEDGGLAMEARGGALYTRSDLANENEVGSLRFAGNAAHGKDRAYGGAAYFYGGCNMSVTKELVFTDNVAESGETGDACGGALYLNLYKDSAQINSAGTMEFCRNSVRGFSAGGGALYCAGSDVFLSAGQELIVRDNTADAGETGSAVGGAMYSTSSSSFRLSGGKVTIVGNSARGLSAQGGAIYAKSRATLTNSDLLVMRGNYVRTADRVELNAIHMGNTGTSSSGNLSFLFNEGQRAEIYDSVNARVLNLNSNAANTGTILFSGAYTEKDLGALKADYTQEELAASRRIYASAGMSITYGELQVRDGMQMVSDTTFKQAATAHMTLHDAGISAAGALTTAAVHFSGANVLSSATSLAGTTWTLALGEANKENAVLTLAGTKSTGAVTMGALTGISLEFDEELTSGTYKLISFDTTKVTWSSLAKTALSGACQSLSVGSGTDVRLMTEGDTQTLVFDYVAPVRAATTLTWGGGSGTWQQGETAAWTGSVKDLTFRNGDSIVFDKGGSVSLVGEVTPASVTVTGSGTLSLSGSGSLTGTTSLIKTGSGVLTISTANSYMGGTTLNGGTLTVNNDKALGSGAVTLLSGTLAGRLTGCSVLVSGGSITAELAGSNSITGNNYNLLSALNNSGSLSLSGSFKADNLTLRHSDATHVDVNGVIGAAGFAKAAFDEVTVVSGGSVINNGATVTHGSLSLELGSNGVASRGGTVNLSDYRLVSGTSATSAAIHAKSATAGVTMSGGTLTVNDTVNVAATGGTIALSGGSLNGTVTGATINAASGALTARLSGANTLNGSGYALTSTLSNSGTLTLKGSFDASALTLNAASFTHVDVNGVSGANGFTKYGDSSVTLVSGGRTENNGAVVTHGSLNLTLGTDGVARAAGATVYTDYLLTSGATVTSAAVHAKGSGAVITQTGGTLTVNDAVRVNATGGTIALSGGSLGGAVSGATINATNGALTASLSGTNTLKGTNYALSGSIANTGNLTMQGSFNASSLTLNTTDATHVDVNGVLGASGFARSAQYAVTLVNGGTVVNNGAAVTHGSRTMLLGSNGIAVCGGEVDKSTYLLTGRDSVSTAAIHAQSSGAGVTMNGGTLTVNDRAAVNAAGGQVNLAGGTLVGSLSTTGSLSLAVQKASGIEGALTLGGGVLGLSDTLNVSGMLNVSGATALDLRSYTRAGDYTLIRAAGISGDLSMLSYETHSGKFGYTLSRSGNDLKLLVSRLSENHIWTAPKGTLNGTAFAAGDTLEILAPASITLAGEVKQGGITVDADKNVTLSADKKTPGSRLGGDGTLTKNGQGVLSLNAGNTYTGGTVLNAGTIKATAADSFGAGDITVNGGVLDLGGKTVENNIILSGGATIKGDAKYAGTVTVEGNAMLMSKTSYKGTTTIGTGNTLTLDEKAGMSGNIVLEGGLLRVLSPKGLTLSKGQTMMMNDGTVSGWVTLGAGSTLVWSGGSFMNAPVLKGGTLDLGGASTLTLTGSNAQIGIGGLSLALPGKGTVCADGDFSILGGTVTVNGLSRYEGAITVKDGATLKMSTGKLPTNNAVEVQGSSTVVNGSTHSGDITVNGWLGKGTNIKLISATQRVELNGNGTMLGSISGAGIIDVNASIDATAAKLTASRINLNSGTFTNTKGVKVAKGQTLTLAGATLRLGSKGVLATAAGSQLVVSGPTLIAGGLTLGGGELVFAGGSMDVYGTLTLSKPVTVTGSGVITYSALKPIKGDISALFGGALVEWEGNTLTITGASIMSDRMAPAPLDAAPAVPPAANPVADAVVQADWGIIDAERAFMGAVNNRRQHTALLDKGQGAAWVSAFGSSVRHGNQGVHHGSDGNIEGAAFGLEHTVSETGSIGLAVGRSKNRLAATGVTHLRQETAHVALYGQKLLKHGFSADAAAAYGDTETKLGAAAWTQKSAALSARLTHALQLTDATAFRTFGGLSYEATDSASILGAAHTGSVQDLRAELGAGATHTAGKAHFYAEAALTGDIIRHNPTAELDGIRTHGANPGRIGVRATLGGMYEFTDTWSGTASYGIDAESRSTSHTLNIGVSKSF